MTEVAGSRAALCARLKDFAALSSQPHGPSATGQHAALGRVVASEQDTALTACNAPTSANAISIEVTEDGARNLKIVKRPVWQANHLCRRQHDDALAQRRVIRSARRLVRCPGRLAAEGFKGDPRETRDVDKDYENGASITGLRLPYDSLCQSLSFFATFPCTVIKVDRPAVDVLGQACVED